MDEAFIRNLADMHARAHPRRGTVIDPEPEGVSWPDVGVNVQVLEPGRPACRYHSEPVQEDFLVLHGSCLVILDGVEHRLRQWDFVHCPAGTDHVFVGAGNGPSAVLMIGSRREDRAHYPVDELAARYDASVQQPTDVVAEAYADWSAEPWTPVPAPWPPG
ncbi:MAG TPA: cupin domain-containing protein [Baekduia sp.]|nr:cupin domain-containing protein [Baekduia sp.]